MENVTDVENETYIEQYSDALDELIKRYPFAVVKMDYPQLFAVIATCQLSLRHPDFPPNTREIVTDWIKSVIARIPSEVLRENLLKGFNSEFDQKI